MAHHSSTGFQDHDWLSSGEKGGSVKHSRYLALVLVFEVKVHDHSRTLMTIAVSTSESQLSITVLAYLQSWNATDAQMLLGDSIARQLSSLSIQE